MNNIRIISLFLMLLIWQTGSAQSGRTVNGTVYDEETRQPLPGVSISLQNAKAGTVTDTHGKFNLTISGNDAVLTFKYIGYESKDVSIPATVSMSVTIRKDNRSLDEVVVIGYGEVQRKDVTGSVGSVKMEDIKRAPVGSALEALAGRVAGVQVTSESGKPGSGVNIVVRGANSLTQSNEPLYVIDGFPMEDANANVLNPAEIESIEILKDASATAIYGARGANGVVLITTRKGKEGAPVINYSGYVGIQQIINKMELMNPYEFVKLQRDIDSVGIKLTYFRDGKGLEDYRNAAGNDWQDLLFKTATMQDYSLSVMGGNKSTKYSFSGNVFDQDGIIINSGFRRYQGKMTLDQTFNKLKVGVNAMYTATRTSGTNPSAPDATYSAMNYLMYSVWGYRPVGFGSDTDLVNSLIDPDVDASNDYRINPIMSAENEYRANFNNRLIANGYAEYAFTKDLKFRINGGINKTDWRQESFNNSMTRYGYWASINKVNGSIMYTDSYTWLNENLLTYNKKFGKDHTLNAVAGITFQENVWKRYGLSAIQLPNENLGLAGLSQGIAQPVTSLNTEWSLMSYLARVNYSYQNKYLLTASYRADGSSKFRKNNRWGYFPSAAFAWRLINESFMKEQTLFSDAKVRLGYGVTGNNRVNEYATYAQLSFDNTGPATNGYYPFNNTITQGVYLSSIANPDLRWESTKQSNIGVDLGLFKQRLLVTVDYYKKKTTDLLLNASLPLSTGYSTAFKNIGATTNQGLEISLSGDVIKKNDFNWNSSFNIAFNKNRVVSLTENQESITSTVPWDQNYTSIPLYIAKIGQPIGQIYGFIWDGVYQYEDFNQLPNGTYELKSGVTTNGNSRSNIRPGDIKYRDLNGDNVVDNYDRTVIGNAYPIHQGGFSNNFRYKNFDLNVFMQWSYGNDVVNANRLWFEAGNKTNLNQFATFENRWTPDNQTNDMFRVGGMGPYAYSSRVVEDASYLRLKTVSFGYNFDPKVLSKLKIRSLRVYATAQNLYTFTNYSGFDPEVAVYYSALTPGFDYSSYPRPKTFVFGINVGL